MDIDDILTSVDADAIPQETRDLQALTRAWVAERVAPEILPWPEELMGRMLGRVRVQIEEVEMQTGNLDPKTSFHLIIIQTELERFKFLIRSFLRARIAKIDTHALHILTHLPSSSSTISPLLSPPELSYLRAHQELLSTHYQRSFLSSFPPQLQRLDDTAGGISMIDAPDLDRAVFVRVLRDGVVVEDVGGERGEGRSEGVELRRGGVHVIRYSVVREELRRGDVELI